MPTDQIAFALARIGTVLKSFAWADTETLGVNPTQAQILARLAARGPSRVGDLAADLGVSQPTASDAVAALLRKGMLERRPDPGDGRASWLHLTGSGHAVAATARSRCYWRRWTRCQRLTATRCSAVWSDLSGPCRWHA